MSELPDDPSEEAEEGGDVKDEEEEEGRHVEGGVHPVPGKVLHLVLQLLQEETLAGAPLGVQTHRDGGGEGGLRQDVRQGAAVEIVAQHVLTVLVGVQFPGSQHLAEDCFLVGDVNVVRSLSTSKQETLQQ